MFLFAKNVCFSILFILGEVLLLSSATINLTQAQVSADGTLSTQVNNGANNTSIVTGGTEVGSNLFHSFNELSVPTSGSVFFDHGLNILNIFSRVTGNSISTIDGSIRANGSANLFLINPNGIIFGPNAQLNIGGSFIATTANQVNFADGAVFSATDLQPHPMLTVSTPIGIQFRQNPGDIVIRSGSGLQVQPGNTLAFLGGNIVLDGAVIELSNGRIELGSIAGPAFVSLSIVSNGLSFGYNGVEDFQDISFSNASQLGFVIPKDINGIGEIHLQGRNIMLESISQIAILNFGSDSGGIININASNLFKLDNQATISSVAFSTGSSADVFVQSRRLLLLGNNIFLGTIAIENSTGRAGNLTVVASDSVEIDAQGGFSPLTTQTFGSGNAGDLSITTSRLILRNGGQVNSSTFGFGNGGRITINASDSIEISGQGSRTEGPIASGLFSVTGRSFSDGLGQAVTGSSGSIILNTPSLVLRDGGTVSVGSEPGSVGQAGNLSIQAADIFLFENSEIISNAAGSGSGGNIGITTDNLVLQNSRISANSVDSFGGRIDITASGIFSNQPLVNSITATSEAGPVFNGTVNTNIIDVDPNKTSTVLPSTLLDPEVLIGQNVCRRGSKSEFIITGKGGLPSGVNDDLSDSVTQVSLIAPVTSPDHPVSILKKPPGQFQPQSGIPNPLASEMPAQGWIFSQNGDVSLVAYRPDLSSQERLQPVDPACPMP